MTTRALFSAALARLDPADTVERALSRCEIPERDVIVLALGKAATAMALGAQRALGERIIQSCVVRPRAVRGDEASEPEAAQPPQSCPDAESELFDVVIESAHPRPDAESERAGRILLSLARGAAADTRLLALISGGGSSLAVAPAPGLSPADRSLACDLVYRAGASIDDLNCVRKHLSAIKGGRLAAAATAPVTTLVSSDVPGDDMSAVASGPTIPDPTTFETAVDIVEATVGLDALPDSAAGILRRGAAGEIPDTPASPRDGDEAILVAGIGALVAAAIASAKSAGLEASPLGVDLSGPVEHVAHSVAAALRVATRHEPVCLVAGGEPTIAIPDDPGTGGRASHLALLLARELSGQSGVEVLVAGSDGIDGNSSCAGAVVDGTTWERVGDGAAALARFDSAAALGAAGCAVVTGATGINHADVLIAIVGNSQFP